MAITDCSYDAFLLVLRYVYSGYSEKEVPATLALEVTRLWLLRRAEAKLHEVTIGPTVDSS